MVYTVKSHIGHLFLDVLVNKMALETYNAIFKLLQNQDLTDQELFPVLLLHLYKSILETFHLPDVTTIQENLIFFGFVTCFSFTH